MTEHDKCLMTNFFFCEATATCREKIRVASSVSSPLHNHLHGSCNCKEPPPPFFFLTSAFQWIRKRGRTFRPQAFIRRLFISTDCFLFFFWLIGKLKFCPCRGYLMMTVNMNNTLPAHFVRSSFTEKMKKKSCDHIGADPGNGLTLFRCSCCACPKNEPESPLSGNWLPS